MDFDWKWHVSECSFICQWCNKYTILVPGCWYLGGGHGDGGWWWWGIRGNMQDYTVNLQPLLEITSVFKVRQFWNLPIFHQKEKKSKPLYSTPMFPSLEYYSLFLTFQNNTMMEHGLRSFVSCFQNNSNINSKFEGCRAGRELPVMSSPNSESQYSENQVLLLTAMLIT